MFYIERESEREVKNILKKLKCCIPSLITAAIVLIVLCCKGIWPFGSFRIDYFDNMQQVAPLYTHLWDWMHGDASLWFDWYTGLGTNVSMSISAFSMLSPFNLVLYFIPRNLILESFSIIVLLKMAVSAFTMYLFLQWKYKEMNELFKNAFALIYSFCGYSLLYGSCFMPWLDFVAIFPLLIMSYEYMLENNKKRYYIIMTAIGFIMNYYLAAMSLIYILFISGIHIFLQTEKENRKRKTWNLGIGTFTGMAISAFVLVPVSAQLSESQRSGSSASILAQYGGWITSSIVTEGKLAVFQRWMMLFGLSFAFAIIAYAIKKKVASRNDNIQMFMIGFIGLVPLLVEGTNLMWHFGSYNGYPLRNGYIVAFSMIYIAGYYAEKMKLRVAWKEKLSRGNVAALVAATCCLIGFGASYQVLSYQYIIAVVLGFMMMLALFTVIHFINIKNGTVNGGLVVTLLLVELGVSSYMLLGPPKVYRYEAYQYGDYVSLANQVKNELEVDESVTDRMINPDLSLNANYPLMFRRSALSSFTAALQSDTQTFAWSWGYSKYFWWLLDSGGTVFSDALLHTTQAVNQNELDEKLYTKLRSTDTFSLYEANYQLPFGLTMSHDLSELSENDNWITMQNQMYQAMSGDEEPLITGINYVLSEEKNISHYTLKVDHNRAVYMSILDKNLGNHDANCSEMLSGIQILVNGQPVKVPTLDSVDNTAYMTDFNNNLLYLGIFDSEEIQVDIVYDEEKFKKISEVCIAQLSMDKMESLCNQYENQHVETTTDNHSMTIHVENNKSETMYYLLPVIYSDNWNITVNGQKADGVAVAGLFTQIPIENGKNTIVLTFIPKGYEIGKIITISVLILIALCMVLCKQISKIRVLNSLESFAYGIYGIVLAAVILLMIVIPVIMAIPAIFI